MASLRCKPWSIYSVAISAVGSTSHECNLAAGCDCPACSNFHIKEIGQWTSHIFAFLISVGAMQLKERKSTSAHHQNSITSTLDMLWETNDMFRFGVSFFKLLWASAPSPNNLIGITYLRSVSGSLLPACTDNKKWIQTAAWECIGYTLTTSHSISFTLCKTLNCNLFSAGALKELDGFETTSCLFQRPKTQQDPKFTISPKRKRCL